MELGGIAESIINSSESVEDFHNWSGDRTFEGVIVDNSLFFETGLDSGRDVEGETTIDRVLHVIHGSELIYKRVTVLTKG